MSTPREFNQAFIRRFSVVVAASADRSTRAEFIGETDPVQFRVLVFVNALLIMLAAGALIFPLIVFASGCRETFYLVAALGLALPLLSIVFFALRQFVRLRDRGRAALEILANALSVSVASRTAA